MRCLNQCCEIYIEECEPCEFTNGPYRKKAGVLVYNSDTNKVLLVQSRGRLWGFPKGTIEPGEKSKDCAVRELWEETGISISKDTIKECICVHNKGLYYIYDLKEEIGSVQPNTDANGITWMKIECVKEMYESGDFQLNYHCRYLLQTFFGIKFNRY
jgi:8-oxo-dGTP pyrophosphatase MutT (NUDIX family)